jgi:hypothetical protein
MSLSSSYNEKCFGQKLYRKSKHTFCVQQFLSENPAFLRQCGKNGKAGQVTDDNITRRVRFARWITKATDTNSEYVILIAFPP